MARAVYMIKTTSGVSDLITVDVDTWPETLDECTRTKVSIDRHFPFVHFTKKKYVKYRYLSSMTPMHCIDMSMYDFVKLVGYPVTCVDDKIDELNMNQAIAGNKLLDIKA